MQHITPPVGAGRVRAPAFVSIVSALLLTALTPLHGGTFTTDFAFDSGGTLLGKAKIEDGRLKLQDLQEYLDGASALPMHGAYVFPEIDPGEKLAGFTATFKVSIQGGTETPAQGFSLVFADDIATLSAPFREGGGSSQGLVISFDTVDNSAGNDAEGNEPGDAPGIIVKFKGQKLAARKFGGLRTGPPNNQAPVFVPVEVKLDSDGTLDVTYNGNKVYDNFGIPYIPLSGHFGVGTGTAEITAAIRCNHWFDDMAITTTTLGAGPALVSVQPLGSAVRPDAPIVVEVENLGGGAVAVQLDGQTVAHQASTAGGITTIRHQPATLLTPRSSHTAQVTFGNRSVTWTYVIANATVIPASAAIAASQVDTTASGFKVRVHQMETVPAGGNSA